LCNEHLTENSVTKENRIKCGECKQDFQVKNNEFQSIKILKKQIDDFLFLSDEEFSLKKQIEGSIRKFFQLYEQFTLDKTKLDLDVHNHFQEIRRNIDLHREKLKETIDDIYMETIQQTKKFEVVYLKNLEDQSEASLKSFEMTSLEQSLKETEETFRIKSYSTLINLNQKLKPSTLQNKQDKHFLCISSRIKTDVLFKCKGIKVFLSYPDRVSLGNTP
jgi:hypothetical protein